jgi:hypothetical protein
MRPEDPNFLTMYTIYGKETRDRPGWFVCRPFLIGQNKNPIAWPICCVAQTKEELSRPFLGAGLQRMPRQLGDDKNIVETWF